MFVVYEIKNTETNKKYFGYTSNLQRRMFEHKNCKLKKGQRSILYRSIQKYGWQKFTIRVIGESSSLSEIKEAEKSCIDLFQSNNRIYGYNLTNGGDGATGLNWSNNSKNKLSQSMRGCGNGFYNKKHTKETKKLISKRKKEARLNRKIFNFRFLYYLIDNNLFLSFYKTLLKTLTLKCDLCGAEYTYSNLKRFKRALTDIKNGKQIMVYTCKKSMHGWLV